MAKIDLEKVLIALLDSPFNKQFDDKVKDALKEQGLEYKDGEIVEIQKPKFKVGDWIVSSWGSFWRIKGIDQFYLLEGIDGREAQRTIYWVNNTFHNWTIQDAKPGDVLVYNNRSVETILLFKKWMNGVGDGVCSYAHAFNYETLFNNWPDCGYTPHPATKKQRDFLFKKMKEAGYEWDTYKLELKKIEPKFKVGDKIKYNGDIYIITKVNKNWYDVTVLSISGSEGKVCRCIGFGAEDKIELVQEPCTRICCADFNSVDAIEVLVACWNKK